MDEKIEWKKSPSQWMNLGVFLLAGVIAVAIGVTAVFSAMPLLWLGLVFPVGWVVWAYLTVRCQVYELTSQRLRKYEGVLNQKIDELELYRIKDMTMTRPFVYRLVGLSTLVLQTSDRSHPEVKIEAVRDALNLREILRRQVEYWRDKKRVREVDFEDAEGESMDML